MRSAGIPIIFALLSWLGFSIFQNRESGKLKIKRWGPSLIFLALLQIIWLWYVNSNTIQYYTTDNMNSYFNQFLMKDPHNPWIGNITFFDFFVRVITMFSWVSSYLSNMFLHLKWTPPLPYSVPNILLSSLLIIGLFTSIKNRNTIVEWYVLIYLLMLMTFPFQEGARFILPIFPFVFYYVYIGLFNLISMLKSGNMLFYFLLLLSFLTLALMTLNVDLLQRFSSDKFRYVTFATWSLLAVVFTGLIVFDDLRRVMHRLLSKNIVHTAIVLFSVCSISFGFYQQINLAAKNLNYDQKSNRLYCAVEAAEKIVSISAKNDVIMASQRNIVHRFSKRRVIPFPVTNDPDRIIDTILNYKVKYLIVLDKVRWEYVYPDEESRLSLLIDKRRVKLTKIARAGAGRMYTIYKVIPTS